MQTSWPDRRRRHAVRLDATVCRNGDEEVPAVVTDLSLEGCCISGSFRIGERVIVRVPRIGKLEAEIRWAFLGRAGARFITQTERGEAAGETHLTPDR